MGALGRTGEGADVGDAGMRTGVWEWVGRRAGGRVGCRGLCGRSSPHQRMVAAKLGGSDEPGATAVAGEEAGASHTPWAATRAAWYSSARRERNSKMKTTLLNPPIVMRRGCTDVPPDCIPCRLWQHLPHIGRSNSRQVSLPVVSLVNRRHESRQAYPVVLGHSARQVEEVLGPPAMVLWWV